MEKSIGTFCFSSLPAKVWFGAGQRANVKASLAEVGATKALVLATPHQANMAEAVAADLKEASAGVFAQAAMHTPVEVTEEAMAAFAASGADCTIAIGGGSTTGLGKAIAYRLDTPQIVIPTTYAGSEATPILGQTEQGLKTTVNHPSVLPELIIYDPDLVKSLPRAMQITSGLNAIAHAIEGLYAKDGNPITSLLAREGIEATIAGMQNQDFSAGLYGAWLCGTVLGSVGMALHHKLCHTLGGSFGLPHAETHAIILAHATYFNEQAVQSLKPIADMLGAPTAGQGLFQLAERLEAPLALTEIGFSEADIPKAAEIALSKPYWNPRSFTKTDIQHLLLAATRGVAPGSL